MDNANSIVRARGQLTFYLLDVKGNGSMLIVRKAVDILMGLHAEAGTVYRRIQSPGMTDLRQWLVRV